MKIKLQTSHRFLQTVLYYVIALLLCLMLARHASAQTFDPNPDAPDAQTIAEMRAMGAMLGLIAPPIGWDCSIWIPDPTTWAQVYCEPNPELIAQQEREHAAWIQRLIESSERNSKLLRRRR